MNIIRGGNLDKKVIRKIIRGHVPDKDLIRNVIRVSLTLRNDGNGISSGTASLIKT